MKVKTLKIFTTFSEYCYNFIQKLFQVFYKFRKWFIYLKFPKIFAAFIPESFPEISTNFSEDVLKHLVKILIKFYLKICLNFGRSLPETSRKFSLANFHKFSLKFNQNLTFLQSVDPSFQFFLKLKKVFFKFWWLKFLQNIDLGEYYLI